MIRSKIPLAFALAIAIWLGSSGCGKSSPSNSGTPGASTASEITGTQKDAADAVMAEIKNHWTSGADGWITARVTGAAALPDHFIRGLRDITVAEVQANELSDSDKLNGIDWSGSVEFKQTSCREAGEPGMALDGLSNPTVNRQRGQWCQWVDWQPDPIRIWREKGQWHMTEDTWMLRGTIPTDQDYANAGVK